MTRRRIRAAQHATSRNPAANANDMTREIRQGSGLTWEVFPQVITTDPRQDAVHAPR